MKKNKYVDEWISYSKMDLDSAFFLFEKMHPKPLEIICYHCHQSAEKILKSVLVAQNMDLIKTHDLIFLCGQVSPFIPNVSEIQILCESLQVYTSKLRYPSAIQLTEEETQKTLKNAKILFENVLSLYI